MTTDVVGGVWQFTRYLSSALLQHGHEVSLVSFGAEPSADKLAWCETEMWKCGARFTVTHTHIPLEWMEQNGEAYSLGAKALLDHADQFQPDLIHSNQLCFGALSSRVPVIMTAHSDVLSWWESCRTEAPPDSQWLQTYCKGARAGLRLASRVIAPTRWMADALLRNFEVCGSVGVIHNGCQVNVEPAPARTLRAITAGRLWDEAKDIALLNGVDTVMPVCVAGPMSLREAPRHMANSTVNWLGALEHQDLLREFSASAVYICTSRYEPFGLAPVEAALCGCAVCVRDIPSLREVWGEDALYFKDASSLSRLLQMLHEHRDVLHAFQHRAKERARHYTVDLMARAYLMEFAHACAGAYVA